MEKKILGTLLVAIMMLSMIGCGNMDMLDTNYTYNRAIIYLANSESIEVEVKQWRDYENSEQVQIVTPDGTVYLTSSYNCTLIRGE